MARVLLVDDDPAFGRAAVERLAADGHTVTFNPGAFGALAAACGAAYDMVLVDVRMPGMDGTKLIEYMPRQKLGGAQVLLVSSVAAERLRDLATTYGADGYFCKRDGLDQLCEFVRRKAQRPTPKGPRAEPHGTGLRPIKR
ncbi:MAG: response regulator [Polyangiaceae bacterium]|nr:response regulator [Polyangiaceae bacterium]